MKNSHKIGLLCCALTPTAFADEPASNPASDVINIIVPPIESIPPEQLVRKEEEFKWGDVTEPTPQTTRWNNAFSFKVKSGMMSHSHTQKNITANVADIEAKATSPYVGMGLNWSVGALSFSINGQRTDRRNIGKLIIAAPEDTRGDFYSDSTFWREDYDASVSWRFELNPNHNLLLFGGYKSSKTHYDTKTTKIPTAINLPKKPGVVEATTDPKTGLLTPVTTIDPTTNKPVQVPVIDRNNSDAQTDIQKVLFNSSGPFIGLGYAWRISELSDTRLGFSLAYGKLKGSSNQTDIFQTSPNPEIQPYESKGTQGLRYGLYLTGPIYRSKWGELNYTIGADAYSYSIEQYYSNAVGKRYEIRNKEKVLSVGGSIGYTFDL